MRKNTVIYKLSCLFLAAVFFIISQPYQKVSAADFSTSISGTTSVANTGDTISLTLSYSSSSSLYAVSGSLSYDASKVEIVSVSPLNGFTVTGTNNIVADDANAHASCGFASVQFQVLSGFSAGTSTTISFNNVSGTNESVTDVSGGSSSITVARSGSSGGSSSSGGGSSSGGSGSSSSGGSGSSGSSSSKSGNNYLSALSVNGYELQPAFDKDTLEYSVYVPYECEALDLSVETDSSYAEYAVENNNLIAGGVTEVNITVTAENGDTRVYKLYTDRKQDPNYVASGNCYLSAITPSYGALSPVFDRDTAYYVIEVGPELTEISFTAVCEDASATYNVLGDSTLHGGKDNYFYLVCTAEDETSKIYTVDVRQNVNYEYYLTASFINSVTAAIKSGSDPVTADFSYCAMTPVSAKIFKALQEEPSTTLILKNKNGTITFESENVQYEIDRDWYDLTLYNTSPYAENILPNLASYYSCVFSTGYKDALPGYAAFSVYTELLPGLKVNVYLYDAANNEYIKIVKGITVGEGGTVSFAIDRGGDFLITTKDVTASDYSSQNRNAAGKKIPNQVLIIGGMILCAVVGFAFGSGAVKKNIFKKRGGSLQKSKKTGRGKNKSKAQDDGNIPADADQPMNNADEAKEPENTAEKSLEDKLDEILSKNDNKPTEDK